MTANILSVTAKNWVPRLRVGSYRQAVAAVDNPLALTEFLHLAATTHGFSTAAESCL